MRYFGTDGIRGIANKDLTSELALKVGRAASLFFGGDMVIAKDPRLSSDMLETALVSGILSTGVNAYKMGILPTPAVSLILSTNGKSGGAMISASHNPIEYNGIKFFSKEGFKLKESEEEEIERLMEVERPLPVERGGRLFDFSKAKEIYINKILSMNRINLSGIKIAIDAAFGATATVVGEIFNKLKAEVYLFNEEPDGERINVNCGSTNPKFLSGKLSEIGADVGFAFDGDGDRVIAIDEEGKIVDGDEIMFILSRYLNLRSIVITVMSNLGLRYLLKKYNISFYEVPVGDRNVLYKMLETNSPLGGEQSGHIIYLPQGKTGDGIITSLLILSAMLRENKPLSLLTEEFVRFPQVLRNVEVKNKELIMKDEEFLKEVMLWNKKLNGRGRVLVRPSGTENLIRIMVEGEKEEETETIASLLEESLKKRLAQNFLGDEEGGYPFKG